MKKRFALLFFALVLVTSSCAPSEPTATSPSSQEPVYNTPPVSTAPTATPTAKSSDGRTTAEILTEDFLVEFNGLARTEENPRYGNSPYDLFAGYTDPVSPYYDEVSGLVYFVNHGLEKDNFLYSYKDGVVEPVIEMPVNYPNFYEGYIYYISNDSVFDLYGHNAYPVGKLYRYNIADETIELVLDRNIWSVAIVGDFLYFRDEFIYNEGNFDLSQTDTYRLALSGGEPENIGGFQPFFYGEYQLRFIASDKTDEYGTVYGSLELVSENETVRLTQDVIYSEFIKYYIEDDYLWMRGLTEDAYARISIYLPTGETRFYTHPWENTVSQTVMNGELYMVNGSREIYKYNNSAEFSEYDFVKIEMARGEVRHYNSLQMLETDGKNLYAYANNSTKGESHTSVFIRLTFLEQEGIEVFEQEEISQ